MPHDAGPRPQAEGSEDGNLIRGSEDRGLTDEEVEPWCFRHLRLCPNSYCLGGGEGCYLLGWSSEWELRDE